MRKISIVAAAALFVVPAAALAGEPQRESFEYEGARYTYTVSETPTGRKITGREDASGKPFALHVGKTRVTGHFGFSAVSFRLKDVKPLSGSVEVALR